MNSIWLEGRSGLVARVPLAPDDTTQTVDIAVIGAGITGLTTALLLARAGLEVVVLEARSAGDGTTGNSTGKISALHGTKLSRIAHRHGHAVARAYTTGNTEGRDWLLRYCEEHGVPTQTEDAYTYAQTREGTAGARDEWNACLQAGLPVRWETTADTPFPYYGGVRLPDQAQFNPAQLVESMVAQLEDHGAHFFSGMRVRSISGRGPLRIKGDYAHDAGAGEFALEAQRCVLATGTPILDRGGFFAKLTANRSYCMSFDVPGPITRAMYLSVDAPLRSVRYAPSSTGDRLVVGGAGHVVGHPAHAREALRELAGWAQTHYPGATRTHSWAAQDYATISELPYAGPLLPGGKRIYLATGYDKWGMTNGIAASLALSSQILGGRMDWANAFASWSALDLRAIPAAIRLGSRVARDFASGWATAMLTSRPEHAPVCTHLGGITTWNDAEDIWECPLHGSCFDSGGSVLWGPATEPLDRLPADGAR
ncbi:Putative iron-sulfur binding oxidoreductase [Mycobacteroides abscessus subsp. abscessus]|uniref:Iron-sulfur binding oxidoreductase n=6 Tax=Mycobacteroides abscessus TaxID=36809 RepID=B1MBG3_MYCA9|nr:FAD-dependent oxidoreductase [Mycobacteroides abscessus]EUA61076.1 FAD binding domain protein [Mycobacteroides abscessus 1948]AKP58353.1 FAD-dependent oxidoreductase [Mycobacteroides abscessus UC22]ALM16771.1 FAD-dependent oxidoreductase [Mycobacteroides abscessus]AMU45978.1 FAD-dependent oxidoreductase [Mycobacteroides abscessus]AMU50865.1 FAD-dependent oxidoreductase [Mycobacteroides abscessus]